MYNIRYIENGQFKSVIGGPIRVLSDAVNQINTLCSDTGASEIKDFIGCKWERCAGTICALVVCDEFGRLVKIVDSEESI